MTLISISLRRAVDEFHAHWHFRMLSKFDTICGAAGRLRRAIAPTTSDRHVGKQLSIKLQLKILDEY